MEQLVEQEIKGPLLFGAQDTATGRKETIHNNHIVRINCNDKIKSNILFYDIKSNVLL